MKRTHSKASAVVLRQDSAVRWLFIFIPTGLLLFFTVLIAGTVGWKAALELLFLLLASLFILLFPVIFFFWHWRLVLDTDGLHRRRLFSWTHRSWSEVSKITQSTDARGNEQLWIYFSNGKTWYLHSRYDGYPSAKKLLRKHCNFQLRK